MLIPKPAQSAYENADTDIREMLDRMIAELKATPSWEQRSTQFLEIIDALELAFEGDDEDIDDDFDDETKTTSMSAMTMMTTSTMMTRTTNQWRSVPFPARR